MKRIIFLILSVICIFYKAKIFANEVNIKDILLNETFGIGLRLSEQSRNLAGAVLFDKGKVSSSGNGTFSIIIHPEYFINENYLELYCSRSIAKNFFDINRKYVIWSFPERLKVDISIDEVLKARKSWNHFTSVLIDTSQTYPATCQAIVIDNLNIRGEPSINSRKIGFLKKRSEITLYEESKNIDEIDGEKNPWYKVKLDDGAYGWVYGGYVRIFFEDPNLGYSDKEKILESIK